MMDEEEMFDESLIDAELGEADPEEEEEESY